MELGEHVNFHSSEFSRDVNSWTTPLDGLKKEKKGKQALECFVMDEFPEKHEEFLKVGKSSKEFLVLMDAFFVFVVQQGKVTTQNQETS